jgi:M6 family metalloprotease-like protein
MAYYGTNDKDGLDQYIADFLMDACKGADKLGVDFSQYDNDNDGIIDFVYIIYAGYAESEGAPETTIWPHNWDLISALYNGYTNQEEYYAKSSKDYHLPSFDGKLLNTYACSNELRMENDARCGIGTICHEFSHVLGLPDYYLPTEYPINLKRTTPGYWSLMGSGNYLNDGNTPPNYSAYDKYFLGWLTPEVLSQSQSIELHADGTTTYMIANNGLHVAEGPFRTDTVFYIENRQLSGWDTYLPGHGMLIWRVIFDETDWYNNSPNEYMARYLLVSAKKTSSPWSEIYTAKPEVPFPGSTNQTTYAVFPHSRLENIQETAGGLVVFDFFTEGFTAVEDVLAPDGSAACYNILGQPVDPHSYKGVVISNKQKYLLR